MGSGQRVSWRQVRPGECYNAADNVADLASAIRAAPAWRCGLRRSGHLHLWTPPVTPPPQPPPNFLSSDCPNWIAGAWNLVFGWTSLADHYAVCDCCGLQAVCAITTASLNPTESVRSKRCDSFEKTCKHGVHVQAAGALPYCGAPHPWLLLGGSGKILPAWSGFQGEEGRQAAQERRIPGGAAFPPTPHSWFPTFSPPPLPLSPDPVEDL